MDMLIDGELIRKLRTGRGWTQDELADIAGVSERTIQRVETSDSCSLETKRALAAAFELTLSDLDLPDAQVPVAEQRRFRTLAVLGVLIGMLGAGLGITLDFLAGHPNLGLFIGISGGLLGLLCGVAGAIFKPRNI